MSCYVDEVVDWGHGNKMAHLVCDTPDELTDIAGVIGLRPEWRQKQGTRLDHFDVTTFFRERAIVAGAKAVTKRQMAKATMAKGALPAAAVADGGGGGEQ